MNTNFNFKIRLLGYYNFPNQTMKPEEAYVNDAEELAPLLRMSLESVKDNPCADDYIKDVIDNPAVFIFKDEENKLYAYFTGTGIARITNVFYNKNSIKQVPLKYKRWFIPGRPIQLIEENPNSEGTNSPSAPPQAQDNTTSTLPEDNTFDWTNFIK